MVLAVRSLFRRTDHHQQFLTAPARLIFIRGAHLQSPTRILMWLRNAQVSSSAPHHPKSQEGMICMPGGGGTCGGEPGSSLTPTVLEAQRGPEFKGHSVLHQTPPRLDLCRLSRLPGARRLQLVISRGCRSSVLAEPQPDRPHARLFFPSSFPYFPR